jgi:uncharacterized protein (TIGR01244 family)
MTYSKTVFKTRNGWLAPVALLLGLMSASCSEDAGSISSIKNLKQPSPQILVGGQPSAAQLDTLAELGVKHVINLRPIAELPDFDEAQLASATGMEYHLLPIHGASGLTPANVDALDQLLKKAGQDKIFLHCASGNRVGAMMALRSSQLYGKDPGSAMAIGKAWGLTSLEPEVRRLLSARP